MKLFLEILKFAGLFAVACMLFVLGMNSFSCEPAWAAVPEWVSWMLIVCSFVAFYIFMVNLIRVWPRKDDSDKTPEPPKADKWAFVYEEEHFDAAGRNILGIITNGVNYLFFHVYKVDEDDIVEQCEVFNSITFDKDSLECSYPWTDKNDEILLEALDEADDDPFVKRSFCGDDGVLRTLKFRYVQEEHYHGT